MDVGRESITGVGKLVVANGEPIRDVGVAKDVGLVAHVHVSEIAQGKTRMDRMGRALTRRFDVELLEQIVRSGAKADDAVELAGQSALLAGPWVRAKEWKGGRGESKAGAQRAFVLRDQPVR